MWPGPDEGHLSSGADEGVRLQKDGEGVHRDRFRLVMGPVRLTSIEFVPRRGEEQTHHKFEVATARSIELSYLSASLTSTLVCSQAVGSPKPCRTPNVSSSSSLVSETSQRCAPSLLGSVKRSPNTFEWAARNVKSSGTSCLSLETRPMLEARRGDMAPEARERDKGEGGCCGP